MSENEGVTKVMEASAKANRSSSEDPTSGGTRFTADRSRARRMSATVGGALLVVSVLSACGDSSRGAFSDSRSKVNQPTVAVAPTRVVNPVRISSPVTTTAKTTETPLTPDAVATETTTDPAVAIESPLVAAVSLAFDATRDSLAAFSTLANRALAARASGSPFDLRTNPSIIAQSIQSVTSSAAIASVSSAGSGPELPPEGQAVKVTGVVWGGQTVTVNAEKLDDGRIAFIDSSQPGANRASGRGLSVVYDGTGLESFDNILGTVASMKEGDEPDRDVLTAAWSGQLMLNYLQSEFGRNSIDGRGGPLVSVVHLPAALGGCDSWAAGNLLLFTGACVRDGQEVMPTTVDVGRFAHLTMLAVSTQLAPNLFWTSGQRAAVSIGTDAYFAMNVQNRALGEAHSVIGISACRDAIESIWCRRWKPDELGFHDLDTGAIFDDAVFALREPLGNLDSLNSFRIQNVNSSIWSNALYQIRKAFSGEDGGDMVTSAAAARFDKIVFRALTDSFDNEGDMMSAANAVQQSAKDLGASEPELDVIAQQFEISQLCLKCTSPKDLQTPLALSARTEHRPNVVDAGVLYSRENPGTGNSVRLTEAVIAPFEGADLEIATGNSLLAEKSASMDARGSGDWAVDTRMGADGKWTGVFLTKLSTGKSERLDGVSGWAAPAISESTVVWPTSVNGKSTIRARPTSGGKVQSLAVDGRPILLAVDGNTVAFQLQDGTLGTWDIAANSQKTIASFSGMPDTALQSFNRMPGELVVSGNRVASLTVNDNYANPFTVTVFDLETGDKKVLSESAHAAGLAMKGDTVIWSEIVGDQPSALLALWGQTAVDTDLAGYSFKTDQTAILLIERGQQGFPSIGGGKLAWQDSVSGGDDIYVADLPEGW